MAEILRPGVTVVQTTETPAPTIVTPTLAPCVLGAAFEIVNVLSTDGTLNSKARFGAYDQSALAITESSYPDPRSNIDELDILEETVRPFMLAGGRLSELFMDLGESFLTTSHGAAAAAIKTGIFSGATGLDLDGQVLVLAIDQPVPLDTSEDITVTFSGDGLSSTDAAAQINEAVGLDVATVVGTAPNDRVQITSPTFGALSSVTIRAGANAADTLSLATTDEIRVEGAGYRGQDDNDNDTLTPWIEFYRGDYFEAGAATAFPTTVGLVNIVTNTFATGKASAVTFGSSGTIPILVGDYFFADGVRVNSGEIMKVESSRFKVGTINTALSIADSNGRYTTKVYTGTEVNTLFADDPFSPGHVYFRATELDWETVTPTAASVLGGATGTAATAAVITGSGAGGPFSLAGLTLHYVVSIDGEETEGTFTFTGGPFADMDAVVATIGSNIPGVTPTNATGELRFSTSATGRLQEFTLKADGTANDALGYSDSADTTDTGTDVVFSGLSTQTLQFTLDDNPHVYTAVFTDDSLNLAVDEINLAVGQTVASIGGGSSNKLKITSTLQGKASKVTIIPQTVPSAEDQFKLESGDSPSPTIVLGAGRPYPDAYLDDDNVLHIQPEILRDQVKGFPLDQLTNTGTLYIQYKALRKDVSASALVAGVLRISDVTTLGSVLDPITEDNPLALGMFLAMINAPNFEVKGLGVDEVTAAAPEGTEAAWARAASFLESEEVYGIAFLSQDPVVSSLWRTHAAVMSEPEQGGERIVFQALANPVRKNPSLALSGTQANSTGTSNQMLLDADPASGLLDLGVNPSDPFAEDDEVYLEFEVDGQLRRYNISSVTGALANFRTSFSSDFNTDGFYSTTTLNTVVINAAYSLNVRGESLVIPGSNPEKLDPSLISTTVADANATFASHRVYSLFPDTIKTTINGIEKSLPSYYASAAIVGMIAAQPPQQGFTNFPISGLTGVVGTERFTKRQLNVMAGGGTYILIQDVQGGAVTSRMQLSTDTTSIETRELSITKVVDFVAKFLRIGVRKYIGTNNINDQLLDTIGTTINGMLAFLIEVGVVNGANLNNIVQDASQPDTLLVDVTLDVPFPCNYIRIVLVA